MASRREILELGRRDASGADAVEEDLAAAWLGAQGERRGRHLDRDQAVGLGQRLRLKDQLFFDRVIAREAKLDPHATRRQVRQGERRLPRGLIIDDDVGARRHRDQRQLRLPVHPERVGIERKGANEQHPRLEPRVVHLDRSLVAIARAIGRLAHLEAQLRASLRRDHDGGASTGRRASEPHARARFVDLRPAHAERSVLHLEREALLLRATREDDQQRERDGPERAH